MLRDLAAGDDVDRHCRSLLRKAGVDGQLPTPVEEIIAAADLVEPEDSLLSDNAIAEAPKHLRTPIGKLKSKVEALLDYKAREIHIDPEIQIDGQRRFKQLHEVAHKILPWQEALAYADDRMTLSWSTRVVFEQEANQSSAELLFQRDLFMSIAQEYETGFAAIVDLSERFDASIHASFRRYVETHKKPVAGLVLKAKPCQANPLGYWRQEAINSDSWIERYGAVAGWHRRVLSPPFSFIENIDGLAIGVPIGCTFSYPNLNQEMTELRVELFSNGYRVFALMWPPQRERFKRRRRIVPSVDQA